LMRDAQSKQERYSSKGIFASSTASLAALGHLCIKESYGKA
jgi:hypothetical protein